MIVLDCKKVAVLGGVIGLDGAVLGSEVQKLDELWFLLVGFMKAGCLF
jgi:hypothetical protein